VLPSPARASQPRSRVHHFAADHGQQGLGRCDVGIEDGFHVCRARLHVAAHESAGHIEQLAQILVDDDQVRELSGFDRAYLVVAMHLVRDADGPGTVTGTVQSSSPRVTLTVNQAPFALFTFSGDPDTNINAINGSFSPRCSV